MAYEILPYKGISNITYNNFGKVENSLQKGFDTYVECGDNEEWVPECFEIIQRASPNLKLGYEWPSDKGNKIMLVKHLLRDGMQNEDYLGLLKEV